jgi:predicted DNA-binding transcriptional regulator AlpA
MSPDVHSTDELERTIIALDDSRTECETYRQAWLRAEGRLENAHAEITRLKKLAGREDVLYIPDIATLAGVSKHTVHNWITRHEAFPKPYRGTNPREWDREDVVQWLTETGRMK